MAADNSPTAEELRSMLAALNARMGAVEDGLAVLVARTAHIHSHASFIASLVTRLANNPEAVSAALDSAELLAREEHERLRDALNPDPQEN